MKSSNEAERLSVLVLSQSELKQDIMRETLVTYFQWNCIFFKKTIIRALQTPEVNTSRAAIFSGTIWQRAAQQQPRLGKTERSSGGVSRRRSAIAGTARQPCTGRVCGGRGSVFRRVEGIVRSNCDVSHSGRLSGHVLNPMSICNHTAHLQHISEILGRCCGCQRWYHHSLVRQWFATSSVYAFIHN